MSRTLSEWVQKIRLVCFWKVSAGRKSGNDVTQVFHFWEEADRSSSHFRYHHMNMNCANLPFAMETDADQYWEEKKKKNITKSCIKSLTTGTTEQCWGFFTSDSWFCLCCACKLRTLAYEHTSRRRFCMEALVVPILPCIRKRKEKSKRHVRKQNRMQNIWKLTCKYFHEVVLETSLLHHSFWCGIKM